MQSRKVREASTCRDATSRAIGQNWCSSRSRGLKDRKNHQKPQQQNNDMPKIIRRALLGLLVILVVLSTNGDAINCKTKVRDVALKYCQGAGRFARSVSPEIRQASPRNKTAPRGFPPGPDPMAEALYDVISDLLLGSSPSEMNLSSEDFEDLYKEVIERLPRASKNKDQTMKMLATLVAKCCNGNLNEDCDPSDVITCPS